MKTPLNILNAALIAGLLTVGGFAIARAPDAGESALQDISAVLPPAAS